MSNDVWIVGVESSPGKFVPLTRSYHSEIEARNFLPLPTSANGNVCIFRYSARDTVDSKPEIVARWDLENDEWTQ